MSVNGNEFASWDEEYYQRTGERVSGSLNTEECGIIDDRTGEWVSRALNTDEDGIIDDEPSVRAYGEKLPYKPDSHHPSIVRPSTR